MIIVRNDLMNKAIKDANELIDTYTDSDLKCFVFDRLVDAIYDRLLQDELREVYEGEKDKDSYKEKN